MSTDPRSPDYDVTEAAYEMMDELERSFDRDIALAEFRKERQANVRRANELRERQINVSRNINNRRARLAERRLAQQREQGEQRLGQRQSEAQARESRFAQTQAQKEQARQDRERRYAETAAYRDAQAEARNARRAEAQRTPVSFSSGTQGAVPGGPNKETVARFIVVVTVLAAIGGMIRNAQKNPIPQQMITANGVKVKVPTHLHTLAGSFIAGTVALLVNEVYPAAGLVLGLGIGTLLVIPTWTPILGRIGGGLVGAAPKPAPTITIPGAQKIGPAPPRPPGNTRS